MKSVACKDVSGIDCEFVAESDESDSVKAADEIKMALAQHGAEAHAEEMDAMTPAENEEMITKINESLASQE